MDKQMKFPCTKQCLVYASCQKICWPYRDYIEEAFRQRKYRCFKIIPPPPLQIQQLSKLMNRVSDGTWLVQYFPSEDTLLISYEKKEQLVSVIGDVRKRNNLYTIRSFPEELK